MVYDIDVSLEEGTDRWYTICVCDTPEAAAEVIRVLLSAAKRESRTYRVRGRVI